MQIGIDVEVKGFGWGWSWLTDQWVPLSGLIRLSLPQDSKVINTWQLLNSPISCFSHSLSFNLQPPCKSVVTTSTYRWGFVTQRLCAISKSNIQWMAKLGRELKAAPLWTPGLAFWAGPWLCDHSGGKAFSAAVERRSSFPLAIPVGIV